MSTDFKAPPEQTAASLLRGIVGDLQHLLQQQLQLMRQEVGNELRQSAAAGAVIAFGMATLLLGGFAVCLGLSHLLYWLLAPVGTDPGWFPLWACYGSVAVVFLIAGGVTVRVGRNQFRGIKNCNLSPKIVEEPVEWKNQP